MIAVLFDLDGTLIDSEISFEEMRERLASKFGVDKEELRPLYEGVSRLGKSALRILCEEEVRRMERCRPIRGMVSLLEDLRRTGVRVGVVTRACRMAAEVALERCVGEVDVLVTADDVEKVKPNPEHVRKALELLGDPEVCVFIGDPKFDRIASEKAGCLFLRFRGDPEEIRRRLESIFKLRFQ